MEDGDWLSGLQSAWCMGCGTNVCVVVLRGWSKMISGDVKEKLVRYETNKISVL